MSRIPDSLLWPTVISDEPQWERWIRKMDEIYQSIREVVNGKIELSRVESGAVVTQNMGYPVTGTSDAVAGTSKPIPHSLGRQPVFLWIMPEHDLVVTAVAFYWTAADYAAWTENTVSIRCTAALKGFRGWVI